MWFYITYAAFLLAFYGYVVILKRKEHAMIAKFEADAKKFAVIVEKLEAKEKELDSTLQRQIKSDDNNNSVNRLNS